MKWTSVYDSLPKISDDTGESDKVLAMDENENHYIAICEGHNPNFEYTKNADWYEANTGHELCYITHWCKIPRLKL